MSEEDGTKTVATLGQINNGYSNVHDIDPDDVEVGDRFGRWEVLDIDHVECDHPEWIHRLSDRVAQGPVEVTRECQVCGKRESVELDWEY